MKPESTHFFASVRISVSCGICLSGSVFPKYFCPSNHRPVIPTSSAASKICPNGDLYLYVYIIFIPQKCMESYDSYEQIYKTKFPFSLNHSSAEQNHHHLHTSGSAGVATILTQVRDIDKNISILGLPRLRETEQMDSLPPAPGK